MALALDASAPTTVQGTTQALTTASFTPPAGAVLVLLFGANDTTVDASLSTVTNTGTAATWTRRVRKSKNAASDGGAGTDGAADIWTATAPGGAITVTATSASATTGSGHEKMMKLMVVTGADTSALTNVAAASSTTGLASVTVTSCIVGSYVFAIDSD